jgi:hypothetical protein
LTANRFFGALLTPQLSDGYFDCSFGLNYLAILAALCLLAPHVALSQAPETVVVTDTPLETKTTEVTDTLAETKVGLTKKAPGKQPVESEIAVAGMISYGNYRIFGAAPRCNIWAAGVEYSRHSWGHLLKARVDYVVEILPFILLSEPAKADFWGNPESPTSSWCMGWGFRLSAFAFCGGTTRPSSPT